MCGFCGLFAARRHWTTGPADTDLPSQAARKRMGDGAMRVLRGAQVRVVPWQARFRVCGPTGREAIVSDLAAVWREADRVAAAAIDPLDETFLDRLERTHDA